MKYKIISSSIEKGISKSDWFTLKHVGNIKQTFFFFWYLNHHTISAKKFTITGTLEKNTVLFKIDLADFSIRQMNLHSIINAWQILFLIYKKTISGLNFDSANYYLKTVNYLQFIWLSDMQRSCLLIVNERRGFMEHPQYLW